MVQRSTHTHTHACAILSSVASPYLHHRRLSEKKKKNAAHFHSLFTADDSKCCVFPQFLPRHIMIDDEKSAYVFTPST